MDNIKAQLSLYKCYHAKPQYPVICQLLIHRLEDLYKDLPKELEQQQLNISLIERYNNKQLTGGTFKV